MNDQSLQRNRPQTFSHALRRHCGSGERRAEHKLIVEVDRGQHSENPGDLLRDAELVRREFRVCLSATQSGISSPRLSP